MTKRRTRKTDRCLSTTKTTTFLTFLEWRHFGYMRSSAERSKQQEENDTNFGSKAKEGRGVTQWIGKKRKASKCWNDLREETLLDCTKEMEKFTINGDVDQSLALALAGLSSSGSSDSSYACSSWSLNCFCTACLLNLNEGVMRSGEKGSVILQRKSPERFGQSKASHGDKEREAKRLTGGFP